MTDHEFIADLANRSRSWLTMSDAEFDRLLALARRGLCGGVKRLVWHESKGESNRRGPYEYYVAETEIGGYEVRVKSGKCTWEILREGSFPDPCDSVEDGKAKCEAYHKEVIESCLTAPEPVPEEDLRDMLRRIVADASPCSTSCNLLVSERLIEDAIQLLSTKERKAQVEDCEVTLPVRFGREVQEVLWEERVMKTEREIRGARAILCAAMMTPGISPEQYANVTGMSVALQWACGEGGDALQRLIDGEPIQTQQVTKGTP